ncbi:hypothetical protein OIU84_008981 [Salix udensis]|uniref:Phosphoglycerate mutase-like protein 1 n=1 Tax=Salix udensis TaxID=889485 RepID=A0AAD6JQL6_9ROSI|nr:hypothetical protein OIU84_008981 [Salix udensis]
MHTDNASLRLKEASSPLLLSQVRLQIMDSGPGPSLYPLHRCKTIHLVRHAQGVHNVEGEKNYKAYMNPEYLDAPLTQLGWQQVDNLRKHVHASGLSKRVGLVVTSPLLRTLQTAVGVFGGEGYKDQMTALPLMVANVGSSGRAAISSHNSPPFIAVEDCREHFGVHPCDKRHNASTIHLAGCGARKEKEIAIVTHSGFLVHTLRAFGNDCHPSVKKEMCTRFANCELRSMVIVDRSMIGPDVSTTNYPGKVPPGPDLSSDDADEEVSNSI